MSFVLLLLFLCFDCSLVGFCVPGIFFPGLRVLFWLACAVVGRDYGFGCLGGLLEFFCLGPLFFSILLSRFISIFFFLQFVLFVALWVIPVAWAVFWWFVGVAFMADFIGPSRWLFFFLLISCIRLNQWHICFTFFFFF